MSLSCEPKKPIPSETVRRLQQTRRDIGLSPIFNNNTSVEVCSEKFTEPTFTLSGNSKEIISCPDGYTLDTCGEMCLQTATTGVTANIFSGTTMSAVFTNGDMCSLGAYFYENIQNRPLPIERTGVTETNLLQDADGITVQTTNIVADGNFWESDGLKTQGRLNLVGWSDLNTEYAGVSYCFETSGCTNDNTYYIGFGFNTLGRIKIDGTVVVDLTDNSSNGNFFQWNVIPWSFSEGKHIIEAEGFQVKGAALEVYKPNGGLGQLTGATTSGDTGVVYSSITKIGQTYDIGETVGYSCPTGYSMDNCGTGLTCTLLEYIGITSDFITYNLNEVEEINLTYNFTGNTQYTGYTGFWCYEVMGSIPYGELKKSCIPYSSITGDSISIDVIDGLPLIDNEYIVKSSNKFKSKCTNTYTDKKVRWLKNGRQSNSITVGPAIGYIDTASFPETVETPDFDSLDLFRPQQIIKDSDAYFITVIDPPAPILEFVPFDVFENITFRSETLTPIVAGSNSLLLIAPPIAGLVLLSVNGVTVSPNDYEVNTDTNLLTTLNGITFETTDVIQVYYNTTPVTESSLLALENRVKLEVYSVSSIVSGVTATTYNNTVNWNSDNSRYEFFLTEKMDPNIQPIITINGVTLVWNIDVFRSSVIPNKLIFKEGTTLEIGDIISVWYYFSGFNGVGDLGTLLTDTPSFKWSEQLNVLKPGGYYGNSTGLFTIEITNKEDINFDNILYSGTKVYNNNESTYNLTVGPISTTSYTKYIYRIKFTKTYATNITNNFIDTTSYSEVGSFSLNKNYIDNSNF